MPEVKKSIVKSYLKGYRCTDCYHSHILVPAALGHGIFNKTMICDLTADIVPQSQFCKNFRIKRKYEKNYLY